MNNLLYTSADWDFDTIQRITDATDEIARKEMGLTPYPAQIEIISTEQMLDAYSSVGLPLMYRHWTFGKHFARDEALYRKGHQGLAYEIVINSSPCISYLMEGNTATMQALVIAHAVQGHSHFFANNYLFKEWTDAEGILDYLAFAKNFVAECEDKYGAEAVERVLDDAHALQGQGVDRYKRKSKRPSDEKRRAEERKMYQESTFNPLWSTIPTSGKLTTAEEKELHEAKARLNLPEENLLYFLEKFSPVLKGWQRELLRIVRKIAQYFYPQGQTKVMNEGCATYVHYQIMTKLHERGQISDGNFLEFLKSHTGVVMQPTFDDKGFSGWNPYALGFAMMQDIHRMCVDPTAEDREWFPEFAGNQEPYGTLRDCWSNYRDESFILQFLSPKVIRDFRIFHVGDDQRDPFLVVRDIHDGDGYRRVRSQLSKQYDQQRHVPELAITDCKILGDRSLTLMHTIRDGRALGVKTEDKCLKALARLWGFPVHLTEVDAVTGYPKYNKTVGP